MSNYVMDLRKIVGHRPLVMCAAGIIIIDYQGRILLQQRTDNGKWGIPGGALEPGETLEQTASREVLEETGLTVDSLHFFGTYSGQELHHKYPNGDEVYIVSVVYVSDDYHGQLALDRDESLDLSFFEINNLPDIEELNPPDRVFIADFQKRYAYALRLIQSEG